jgi:hypothetical protein
MYINEFLAGVLATLFVELVIIVALAVYFGGIKK